MNIIVLTTGKRSNLLKQSIKSLQENAANWASHTLTIAIDGVGIDCDIPMPVKYTSIFCAERPGASATRNIGASSIPKYKRQEYVCFFDDDVYSCPGWDRQLEEVLKHASCAASGHAHPYNHTILGPCKGGLFTTVLSTVNIACSWVMWDDVGWFAEPGGPGGSEDVDWCARATKKVYGLAVTVPQCVIHTGVTSSSGKPIVGADLVMARNRELEKLYSIEGKVIYK